MSLSPLPLAEKLTELVATSRGQDLPPAEASQLLETLRQTYPDFDKWLSRRFSRLPEAQQAWIIQLLQAAQARAFGPVLQQWSRNPELAMAIRAQAGQVLDAWGEAADPAWHTALRQAAETLQHLQLDEPAPLAEDGQLLPPLQASVQQLPRTMARALIQELALPRPRVALAVGRSLRATAETKELPELVECLASIPTLESVAELQDILGHTADKPLQKAVKKALHRLKTRGLVFDTESPGHAVRFGSAAHRLERCLASHVDANGDRALWMIRNKPFGGYHIAYLVINYGTGIQVAIGLQASKRELPALLDKAQEHVRLVDIDAAYCQRLVHLAHQMNLDTHSAVPEEFFAVRDIIGEPETPFETALIYAELSPDDLAEAQAYGDHAADLLALPEFAGWTLPGLVVQKYADQIREIEESQIVVSSAMKQERIREVYAQAVQEVLGERTRWLMRLRLEEMADYLLKTDRRREALWAVAAAQSLLAGNADRLRRNPFAGALLERSLEVAKARPGSRIIQPFARTSAGGEERRLII